MNLSRLNFDWIWKIDEIKSSTRRQIITGAVLCGAVLFVIALIKYFQISSAIANQAAQTPPPDAVTSLVIKSAPWSDSLTVMGSLSPSQGVTISAEEPGKVVRVAVNSGAKVEMGDVLVELDTSVEEAQLQGAIATTQRTKAAFDRAKKLIGTKAVSDDVFESASQAYELARAAEGSLRALIAKKRVTAPFSGTLGIRQVNVGQFVTAGTALVPLHSLDPIFVDFSVPQSSLGRITIGQKIAFRVDAFPEREFTGEIAAINPQVDPSTRNVSVRATAANPDGALRPGMFVNLDLTFPASQDQIAIPQSAILYAPYGDVVYVIEPGAMQSPRKIRQQVVKLGARRGDQVVVSAGLKPDEEIVTSGAFKLRPDSTVIVNNSVMPSNLTNPQTQDS